MSASTSAARIHWNEVYDTKGAEGVSWYQPEPLVSLELIDTLDLDPARPVIDVGGGASMLVDHLLERGHTDITVLDVSDRALRVAQHRLGDRGRQVQWHAANLLHWAPQRRFALWHDRGVYHFLIDPDEQARYRQLTTAGVAPGGYLIVATFAADGPDHCSGLPVARHWPEDLAGQFGDGFTAVTTRHERHQTPAGIEQPFTWLLARRTEPTSHGRP